MEYSQKISQFRRTKGLTQAKLAEIVGVEQPTIQRWEAGKREPSISDLERVAGALGVDLAAFFHEVSPLGPELFVKGEVAAGVWKDAIEWAHDDWQSFTGRSDVSANLAHRFGLRIVGESMNEIYPNGTIVECVTIFGQAEAMPGKRVVVIRRRDSLEYEATVKELVEIDGNLWAVPRSTNPSFQAFKLNEPEPGIIETRIAAVVVSSIRPE